jgi:hypothetical protein
VAGPSEWEIGDDGTQRRLRSGIARPAHAS